MRSGNRPEVMVNFAADKFDSDGNLLDETSQKLIGELILNLVDWAVLYANNETDIRSRFMKIQPWIRQVLFSTFVLIFEFYLLLL